MTDIETVKFEAEDAARCRCTHEAGDSDCAVHPRCNNCGEDLGATEIKADRDLLLAKLLAAHALIEKQRAEMRDALDSAYVSGFDDGFGESAEGWNAEYPFGQLRKGDHATEKARRLDESRATALKMWRNEQHTLASVGGEE